MSLFTITSFSFVNKLLIQLEVVVIESIISKKSSLISEYYIMYNLLAQILTKSTHEAKMDYKTNRRRFVTIIVFNFSIIGVSVLVSTDI